LLVEIAQSAVCNQLHSVEQRTSRWLLHASERAHTADLRLTHEFLAQMLAVRRSSVTNVVGIFNRAGVTTARRGLIRIGDPDGLRGFACACYEIVRAAEQTASADQAQVAGKFHVRSPLALSADPSFHATSQTFPSGSRQLNPEKPCGESTTASRPSTPST